MIEPQIIVALIVEAQVVTVGAIAWAIRTHIKLAVIATTVERLVKQNDNKPSSSISGGD